MQDKAKKSTIGKVPKITRPLLKKNRSAASRIKRAPITKGETENEETETEKEDHHRSKSPKTIETKSIKPESQKQYRNTTTPSPAASRKSYRLELPAPKILDLPQSNYDYADDAQVQDDESEINRSQSRRTIIHSNRSSLTKKAKISAQITSPEIDDAEDKPSVIVITRPGLTEKKTTYFYYTPTLWEQMKASPCLDVLRASYHKYGVKHAVLLIVLIAYSFFGAGLFLFFEQKAEQTRLDDLKSKLMDARGSVVDEAMYEMFNDSQRFLFFINNEQSVEIMKILQKSFQKYGQTVTVENFKHLIYNDMHWDFWNSMLYAWTIITTIGYGYLHPTTDIGKVFTMIYAIFGIPLFLSVLNDLGKLLTKVMKYPFFLLKKHCRRLFQYCTRMSRDQIKEAEEKDKARLEVFDLPIPIAVGIVIGWIFFCSAITLMWETEWDYLIAFYFFFVSLSTIGFGDVMPSDSKFLLIMFGNIFIGLALVSMCINLIQGKFEKTYQASANEQQERQGTGSAEESTDETSEILIGGSIGKQKKSSSSRQQQNEVSLKSFFKRSSQMSLSAGTTSNNPSRQLSQTSLPNYETSTSTPPPPTVGGNATTTSDDELVAVSQAPQTTTAKTQQHYVSSSSPSKTQQSQVFRKKSSYGSGKTSISPVLSKKSMEQASAMYSTLDEQAKTVDTQTMLSVPYYYQQSINPNDPYQPDHVINVSNQRGMVRKLPSTTSFNEIDRIVDLNINAELLRNELIDIENYRNVLSPQEVIAQIHHERQLKNIPKL